MKNILSILFFSFCFSAIAICQTEFFPVESAHSITKEKLTIKVKTTENETVELSSILDNGKNYVISIMASWCGPCKLELDQLQKVQEKWSTDLNTELLTISIDKPDDTQKVFELFEKKGWTIQVVHDDMAYTAKELKVFGIPQVFLVKPNKEIVYRKKGYKSNLVSIMEKEILKIQ